MKRHTCSECRAYSPLTNQCRRHAPVMVPVPTPGAPPGTSLSAIGLYPATDKDGWCEEFVPDPSVLQ
jgi:hypothetical protein